MRNVSLPAVVLVAVVACSSSSREAPADGVFPAAVAERAVADAKKNALIGYDDALSAAKALQVAVDTFVATPTEASFEAAKKAWIAARVPYAPTEAHRFYDGPIDAPETGQEGRINGWPLDENEIDYTRDAPAGGLVNDLTVELTKDFIAAQNEKKGDKAITTGFHAIEFLLWGQDDAKPGTGPGKRPYTDFVDGGTHANQARRRAYLVNVTALLVEDLQKVRDEWDPTKPGAFVTKFGVAPTDPAAQADATKEVVGKLLRAMGSMAKAELSGERMTVAFKNRSEEDEHSCFSDTTASDMLGNGVGVQNLWLGRWANADGVGLDEVLGAVDPALAAKTTADLAAAVSKLRRLEELQQAGTPIDVILQAPDESEGRRGMLEAIRALKLVGDDVEKAAAALGLGVELEKPSEEL